MRRPVSALAPLRGLGCALLALLGGAALLLSGCATTPLDRRDWLRVETPHFEILSALSLEETRELTRDLERFRGAVGWAQGGAVAPPAAPTRVLAFDGKTLVRPFDQRGVPSYFLPEGDGGIVVLRAGGGFRGDASFALRHELAHWILRGAGGPSPPLWIDEGFAQLLSTIAVLDKSVEVGVLREDHVRRVRAETWIPMQRLLEANPGDDWSDRTRFDAQTWLVAHYLLLGQPQRAAVNQQLRQYLALVDRGVRPGDAAPQAFGADLDRVLLRYMRRKSFDLLEVAVPAVAAPEPVALPRADALTALGTLSLAIDRAEQAVDYLEQAVAADPQHARAHAALGEATLRLGRADEARQQLRLALGSGSADPAIQLRAGDYYRERALATEDDEKRRDLLRLARWHYQQSLSRAPSATAYARLAATSLIDGAVTAQALEAARAARRLQPGSLELELLQARLELAAGNRGQARVLARSVWARAHGAPQREEARTLLGEASRFPVGAARLDADPLHAQR